MYNTHTHTHTLIQRHAKNRRIDAHRCLLLAFVGVVGFEREHSDLAVVEKHVGDSVLDGVLASAVAAHKHTFDDVELSYATHA